MHHQPTLVQALEQFLLQDRAPATIRTYRAFLSRFVTSIGPDRPLMLISAADISAYVLAMRQHEPPYSPITLRNRIKMIQMFFRWGVDAGHLVDSPAGHLQTPSARQPLGQGKAATDEEADLLLAVGRANVRDYALIWLLIESGCRAGEAASLRWPDVDLEHCQAWVLGKGGRRRIIYFGEKTVQALQVWAQRRPQVKHDYVFTSQRGQGRLHAVSVSRVVNRLAQRAGVQRPLHAHSLRHRVGLTFGRQRIAPRITQHYLGHEDIKTTLEYYQDVSEDDLRLAGRLLDPSIAPEPWDEEARRRLKNRRTG